jgi:glycosyltransferase involved in cell wall biosynthesis
MPGYAGPAFARGQGKLTGGILYDYMVSLRFREQGWRMEYFDLETLPRYARSLKFPAPGRIIRACGLDHDVLVTDLGNSPLTLGLQRSAAARGTLTVLLCHHFRADLERSSLKRRLYRYTERRIAAEAALLVANSPHTASLLTALGRDPSDIIVAAPGLSVPRRTESGIRELPSEVLMVGSIEPRKGVLDAVRALAASGLVDVTLTIAGESGEHSDYLREVNGLIETSGLGSRVRLAGRLHSGALLDAYREADAFMLLSGWEGYGMAIAEAMASGLPVISTTAGAIPGLVEHGVSGLLVEPGDWKAAGGFLRDLFTDSALRLRLAQGALEKAKGFPTWEESTGRIFEAVAGRLRFRV